MEDHNANDLNKRTSTDSLEASDAKLSLTIGANFFDPSSGAKDFDRFVERLKTLRFEPGRVGEPYRFTFELATLDELNCVGSLSVNSEGFSALGLKCSIDDGNLLTIEGTGPNKTPGKSCDEDVAIALNARIHGKLGTKNILKTDVPEFQHRLFEIKFDFPTVSLPPKNLSIAPLLETPATQTNGSLTGKSFPQKLLAFLKTPFTQTNGSMPLFDLAELDIIEIERDGVQYKIYSDHAEVVGVVRYAKALVVPSEVEGRPVTTVGAGAFEGRRALFSAVLPDSLTTVREYAFAHCVSLPSLTLPESVTAIGDGAFFNCSSLSSIGLPESLTSVGERAFARCERLNAICVPDSYGEEYCEKNGIEYTLNFAESDAADFTPFEIERDGIQYAIYLDYVEVIGVSDDVENVVLPAKVKGRRVTTIGDEAFEDCSSLASIALPDSVTTIGDKAFWGCSSLASVTLPDAITTIGASAFWGCSSLASVTLPDSVTTIGDKTFWGCSSLASLTLPDAVTTIGDSAFECCFSLASLTLPDALTTLGAGAFEECSSLALIRLPDSLTTFGLGAFSGCSSLASIEASPNNLAYRSIDGVLFNKELTKLVRYPEGKIDQDYAVPKSVITLGDGAFANCSSLSTLTLPDSLTTIEDGAFEECSSLTSLTLPDSVITIGDNAFCGCSSLASLTLPNSLTTIENNAFCGCSSLVSLTLPNSLTTLGDSAFCDCSSLISLTLPGSLTTLGDGVLFGCSSLASIALPDSLTTIGNSAFEDCSSLASIALPDSVTTIGDSAFEDCFSLASLTLPESLTTIGYGAFKNCAALSSLRLPNSLTTIGDEVFRGCVSLKVICEPDSYGEEYCEQNGIEYTSSAAELDDADFVPFEIERDGIRYKIYADRAEAIKASKGVENVVVPSEVEGRSVTTLGDSAFCFRSLLASVTLPDSLTTISPEAFNDCSSLASIEASPNNPAYRSIDGVLFNKELTKLVKYPEGKKDRDYAVPSSVITIGDSAFSGCSSLASVMLPNSLTTIGDSAFFGCSSLASVMLPDSLTTLGDKAFGFCSSLASLTLPDSLTTIGDKAFFFCSSLASLTLPDSIKSIGSLAFDYCSALKVICESDSYVEEYCKQNKIEHTLSTVESNADFAPYEIERDGIQYKIFADYAEVDLVSEDVENVVVPAEMEGRPVASIGDKAFENCTSLFSLTLPNSITTIGDEAFDGCSSLASIDVASDNRDYRSVDGVLFNKAQTTLVKYPAGKRDSVYIIPASVATIGDGAFEDCSSLSQLKLPKSLTTIKDWAFYGCSSLASLTLPDSVTSISAWAFSGCSSLAAIDASSVNPAYRSSNGILFDKEQTRLIKYPAGKTESAYAVPSSVTTIGDSSFEDCSKLSEITLSESLTTIEDWAFNGCSRLSKLRLPKSVTSIGVEAFNDCSSLQIVCVPNSFGEKYCKANELACELTKSESVTEPFVPFEIERNGVQYKIYADHAEVVDASDKVENVCVPIKVEERLVTAIGDEAFNGCSSLSSIMLPDSLTSIGDGAFENCSSLALLKLPDSVTTIGDGAFYCCSSLASLTLPNSLTTIGNGAFKYCFSLALTTLPDSITTIGDGAFKYCSSLASLTLPASLKRIGTGAFDCCSSLKVICSPGSYAEQYCRERDVPYETY